MMSRRATWSAFAVFAAVILASACYTFTRTKLYEGVASSSDLLPPASLSLARDRALLNISYENLAAYAKGPQMVNRIAARITGADLDLMLSSYASPPKNTPELLAEVLAANLAVRLDSPQGPIVIAYRHPDPIIAARLANMIIEELLQWLSRQRIDQTIAHVEDLTLQRELVTKEIEQLSQTLNAASDTTQSEVAHKLATAKQALAEANRRLRETNMISDWDLRSVRRIEPAGPPTRHVYPSHITHLSIGLVCGLFTSALTLLLLSPRRPRLLR